MSEEVQNCRQPEGEEGMPLPVHPGCIFRVGIMHHPDAVPEGDPDKIVYLELPATPDQFQAAEAELGDPGWLGTVFASIDSDIPGIDKLLYTTEDLPELERLAEKLAALAPDDLFLCKALLETSDCDDLQEAISLADSMSRPEDPAMRKDVPQGGIFHIYATQGRDSYAELDLPASDYEMLDMIERLRLEPGQLPYLEILRFHEKYDYLERCIHEQPDIYQLNALARKLSEFTSVQEMAAFEGLVGKEIGKSAVTIELPRLIDFAYSTDCCVIAEDATTDFQLGKFLVENEFIPEANGLQEAALALLDYGKIGREHREQGGGVYTGFGYVEQNSEIVCVSKTMDFQPRKPAYTALLNMAPLPFIKKVGPEDMVQLRLRARAEQTHMALEKLGVKDWNDVAVSILDCAFPRLNHGIYLNGEVPQIMELAQCLSRLDAQGELTKYKAILAAEDCSDLSGMISLSGKLDEYIFEPDLRSVEDVARGELTIVISSQDAEMLTPYIDLQSYGQALLKRDQAMLTEYGLIEKDPSQQIQDMEQGPAPGGMVMT